MRDFPVQAPPPLEAPLQVGLGRLGPALRWLASVQGAWPPYVPEVVRRVVVDGGGDVADAVEQGAALADELADSGVQLAVVSATADQVAGVVLAAALLDLEPVHAVGTAAGPDWAALTVGVRDGLRTARAHDRDPVGLLGASGSPALGRLTGLLAQSAVRRTPVLLDGSPLVCAAALAADHLAPGAAAWWLAGQQPPNPAARRAVTALGLAPLLDLGLALPLGADLALSVLEQAVRSLAEDLAG